MTDLIKFLDNNRKLAVYKGLNIHGLYCYTQLHLPLQVSAIIILVLYLAPKMMQQIPRQLLQISVSDRKLFANDVK